MKSDTRIVFVGLLAIALLEMGVTGKFSALWRLAFVNTGGTAQETTTPGPNGGEPQLHPSTATTTATTSAPPTMTF